MNKLKIKRGLNIDMHAAGNKIVNDRLQVWCVEKTKNRTNILAKLSRENLKTFNNLYDSGK